MTKSWLRPPVLLALLLGGSALVTWLFWHGITFSRRLDDAELIEALGEGAPIRSVEHGIEEVTRRFAERSPGMDRWAGLVVAASQRKEPPVRRAAAWGMQFGEGRGDFVARLRELAASDPDETTRRNAACSLAASRDAAGRSVLRSMLEPFVVRSPVTGRVDSILAVGRRAEQDGLLARIAVPPEHRAEASSPVPGRVEAVLAPEGTEVREGAELARLAPDPSHALNSAAALALVGTADDIPLLAAAAAPQSALGTRVADQARASIEAIRARAGK